MADQYEAADRLLALLDDVDRGRPLRLRDICDRFGVDPACAADYRDWIARRRELVEEREGRVKVWRLKPPVEADPRATARAAALAFAVDALAELEGTDHHAELEALAHQARLSVPEGGRARLDRLTRSLEVRRGERSLNPNRVSLLQSLMKAVEQRRPCRMVYEKPTKNEDYDIHPWGFVLNRGRLLLVAGKLSKSGRPERRFFNVDAIRGLTESAHARFEEPPARQTDWDAAFRDTIGIFTDWPDPPEDVHLRVRGRHPTALRQRAVHSSQQVVPSQDGWCDVHLRVVLCPDLIAWILAMLPDVVVVQPPALRERIQAAATEWLAMIDP